MFNAYNRVLKNMAKISVLNTDITVLNYNSHDYISLTDMASAKEGDSRAADIIKNWIRNRYTIEFLGTWEMIHKSEWIERTNAIGIVVRKGRYGGTYAYKDIAFEFGTAISVPFKLYLIEEFQRLKEQELAQIGWNAKRELSKINYRIHTDAIKQNLIPQEITPIQAARIYANEADVLNMALFGMTALEWRDKHPDLKGNIREYASVNELICLSNMESLNAVFIQDGIPQQERLIRLNRIAIQQMQVLEDLTGERKLLR